MISQFLDALGGWLNRIAAVILMMLPKSPFYYLEQNDTITTYLGYLNFFVPIDFMVSVGTAWLTAVAVYYLYQLILRWAKLIE